MSRVGETAGKSMSVEGERELRRSYVEEGGERPQRVRAAEVKNLVKIYGGRGFQTRVLKGLELTIYRQDFAAIMGPSGSGKTTLLNILSTIDKPTQGTVMLDGRDITHASNKELSKLRRDKIGFVFQDYSLLDTMSLEDNIALTRQFVSEQLVRRCMIADFSIHQSDKKEEGIPNPHFHILCPIRP